MNLPRDLISVFLALSSTTFVGAAPPDDNAREIIGRYVVSHTGWKRSVFRLEKGSTAHSIVRYEVIYVPEERATPRPDGSIELGGGKSFAVEYDPRKQKVIREWHYQ